MGRSLNNLTARKVQTLTTPGRHADGGGLYLVVDKDGRKRWVMLFRFRGGRREMGFGSVTSVSLAQAREMAAAARAQIAGGVDPIEARRAPPEDKPVAAVRTFGQAAEAYMAAREKDWKSPVHRRQWRQTLEDHGASIWKMPVADVDTTAVLAVLNPIWLDKNETAKRLRGRIERILDAAKVEGHRGGENPARWRGHLDLVLPRRKKLARGHHAALPYRQVPGFVKQLRERVATSARALEFIILTAARSGEVRDMTWGEVDLDKALWRVPAVRMKANREHRVPLSPAAVDLLRKRRPREPDPSDIVFGNRYGGPLSDMVFKALFVRAKVGDITTHGFRSSFRDWAGDETAHAREVIEAALAHQVGDETERAYRRGDALAKRRQLLEDWAFFVAGESGVALRKASKST